MNEEKDLTKERVEESTDKVVEEKTTTEINNESTANELINELADDELLEEELELEIVEGELEDEEFEEPEDEELEEEEEEFVEEEEEFVDFEVYAQIVDGDWKGFIGHYNENLNYTEPFMFSRAIKVYEGLAKYDHETKTIIDLVENNGVEE